MIPPLKLSSVPCVESNSMPTKQAVPMTSPQESFRSFASNAAASAPEPMGPALGKISIIWAGFFAGITLGDLVLFATLVYTILQTCLLVYERIIKPIMLARAAARLPQEK